VGDMTPTIAPVKPQATLETRVKSA